MNCKDFKAVINELVYDKVVDAETRQTGFAHAALCPNCAMLLSETQDVRAALQMTVAAEVETAPARVKESLLAAFAAQTKGDLAPAAVVSITSRRKFSWLSAAAIAAAAALLIALLLPALLRRLAPKSEQPRFEAVKPNYKPAAPLTDRRQEQEAGGGNEKPAAPGKDDANAVAVQPPAHKKQSRRPHSASDFGSIAKTLRAPVHEEKTSVAMKRAKSKSTNEFLPLTYLASSTAMESGTVVRVKLSRASLISLGLPVSSDGSNESVKADLIVGDDGVARAIRLVDE